MVFFAANRNRQKQIWVRRRSALHTHHEEIAMAITTELLGTHTWTPDMDAAALCGVCPECGKQGRHTHTEFSGGDGERGYVEYECKCGTIWTDEYRIVTRTVYPNLLDEHERWGGK
jgi:lysyl-tRNA synthetase class I